MTYIFASFQTIPLVSTVESKSRLRRWFGPLPGAREARALSWMAIAVAFILCGISVLRGFEGQTFMGRALGGDFVQFYVAGKILNEHDSARLYDLDLEVRLQHEAVPAAPSSQMLVFASAPWVAELFRPFALLPYRWAYVCWLAFSLAAYSAAAFLLLASAGLSRQQATTGFLLAISSMPFILETWIGGQVSVLGLLAIALFVFCRARGAIFLAGVALAGACFKPTLVAIPVLMLLVSIRSATQRRILAGFATGAATLAVASLLIVGPKGCMAWIDTLKFYGNLATGPAAAFRRTKYIDMGSFFHLLLPGAFTLGQALTLIISVVCLAALALAWWQSPLWSKSSQDLLWAATFAGDLILNVYTPIYDTILVAASVTLVAGVISHRPEFEGFLAWMVPLYIVPWVTQSFAEFLHFQPYTLVLAGFVCWLLRFAPRLSPAQSLRADSYALTGNTGNSGQRLGVSLRSY